LPCDGVVVEDEAVTPVRSVEVDARCWVSRLPLAGVVEVGAVDDDSCGGGTGPGWRGGARMSPSPSDRRGRVGSGRGDKEFSKEKGYRRRCL
jgi:hypothetical protein